MTAMVGLLGCRAGGILRGRPARQARMARSGRSYMEKGVVKGQKEVARHRITGSQTCFAQVVHNWPLVRGEKTEV